MPQNSVEAPGIETEGDRQIVNNSAQYRSSTTPESIDVEHSSVRNDRSVDEWKTIGRAPSSPTSDLSHVVESGLAEALQVAVKAGEWRAVEAIAAELEARRVGRVGAPAGVVVPLTRSKA